LEDWRKSLSRLSEFEFGTTTGKSK
jgi:hypothetical protein